VAAAAVTDEAGTARLAGELAGSLVAGDVVHLIGDLGSGKTTFVQYAAAALGVSELVTSPTFAVAHRYAGPGDVIVCHLDLYRSAGVSVEELADLEAYLGEDAIVFVEWPAAGEGMLPPPTVVVEMAHAGGDLRRIAVRKV
jgi:tRNA threonylcarbamoyladenosine biosynthesis protein TsaE